MRRLDLSEHQDSWHQLTSAEIEELRTRNIRGLSITASLDRAGEYCIRPGSTVGALEIGELSVWIRPKIAIEQLIAIACYAGGRFDPKYEFRFPPAASIHDALALALTEAARKALGRGLLRGYRTEDDRSFTVRGKIDFSTQMRRTFPGPIPVALRFDEHTEDILANQLVKAAARKIGRLTLRLDAARAGIAWIAGLLENVSLVEFLRHPVPQLQFNQLNEHYRDVILLARLILEHVGFESGRGEVRSGGFLLDMDDLFERFVYQALRKSMARSGFTLRSGKNLPIDNLGRLPSKPDLSCWRGDLCTFVGDAKYKNADGAVPRSDIYQVLAYVTSAGLAHGLLVYAAGETEPRSYPIRNSGKSIEVVTLDMEKPLNEVLLDVDRLAERALCWMRNVDDFTGSDRILVFRLVPAGRAQPTRG